MCLFPLGYKPCGFSSCWVLEASSEPALPSALWKYSWRAAIKRALCKSTHLQSGWKETHLLLWPPAACKRPQESSELWASRLQGGRAAADMFISRGLFVLAHPELMSEEANNAHQAFTWSCLFKIRFLHFSLSGNFMQHWIAVTWAHCNHSRQCTKGRRPPWSRRWITGSASQSGDNKQ